MLQVDHLLQIWRLLPVLDGPIRASRCPHCCLASVAQGAALPGKAGHRWSIHVSLGYGDWHIGSKSGFNFHLPLEHLGVLSGAPCELVEQGIWKTHLPILPRQSHERRSFNSITLPLLGGSISRFVPMLVKQAAQRGFHIVLVSPQHAVVVDWWFLFCQSTFQTCPGKLRMPDQGNGCYNSTALKQR